MPTKDRVEMGAAAAGSVYALDQLLEGLQAEKHRDGKEADEHYLKALASAAVAIGAYMMLQKNKDVHHKRETNVLISDNCSEHSFDEESHENGVEDGHRRRLIEEAAGAYAFGRDLMGEHKHQIAHLVAEGLGAAGLFKEVRAHSK